MKRILVTILTILLTIILLGGIAAGVIFFQKYVPTKELADQKSWFRAGGEDTAIFLDNEHVET